MLLSLVILPLSTHPVRGGAPGAAGGGSWALKWGGGVGSLVNGMILTRGPMEERGGI